MAVENRLRYNAGVETFRHLEYPMLKDEIYLDHAGTTPYPRSLLERFTNEMSANLFGNPHSASSSSQLSTSRIEDIRLRALQFLGAEPTEFDLVFVANATAGIKLVTEAFRSLPRGFRYVYHEASHTSLVGVREEARDSLCVDNGLMEGLLAGRDVFPQADGDDATRGPATLVGYAAQSNMDGHRFPLSWADQLRKAQGTKGTEVYTILDAASFVSTSSLELGNAEMAPDFIVLSFYKIFGFPDLGALIVRRQAESVFDNRRYFGGGTVDVVVSASEQWHVPKSQFLHERLEDGTLPIHSIIALDAAMTVHQRLYGTMSAVASHTSFLARRLHTGLVALKHGNGSPVCVVYSGSRGFQTENGQASNGPIVAFNIRNASGAWLSLVEFEKLAVLKKIHIRTGSVCNPGGVAAALGLEPWEMKRNFSAGFRCGSDNDIMSGKPTGVIRASVGAMSTTSDVDRFIAFVAEFYRDDNVPASAETLASVAPSQLVTALQACEITEAPQLFVDSLTVYPIKSCGGYHIPPETDWEIRPEGLAWDREWCLIHRGSGQALSQKRYPNMALIKPLIDFKRGELRIRYCGKIPAHLEGKLGEEISVPLSHNPRVFVPDARTCQASSRVCGEAVVAQTYTSEVVNMFFSDFLGVPCMLARFPPGGQGNCKRHSKAQIQKHQITHHNQQPHKVGISVGGSSGGNTAAPPPSPPDSDVEETQKQRILLSNESPILGINLASVRALNEEIRSRGGDLEVPPTAFRANVVIGFRTNTIAPLGAQPERQLAYSEDRWTKIKIGPHTFVMLGACRRCHMVCVDQETGVKSEEPFITLSKTRRFDGKVFFGTHMALSAPAPSELLSTKAAFTRARQYPTIKIGDSVFVEQEASA